MIDGRLARWLAAAILAAGMACWVLRLSLRRMVLLRLRLRWAGRQEAFSDAAPAAVAPVGKSGGGMDLSDSKILTGFVDKKEMKNADAVSVQLPKMSILRVGGASHMALQFVLDVKPPGNAPNPKVAFLLVKYGSDALNMTVVMGPDLSPKYVLNNFALFGIGANIMLPQFGIHEYDHGQRGRKVGRVASLMGFKYVAALHGVKYTATIKFGSGFMVKATGPDVDTADPPKAGAPTPPPGTAAAKPAVREIALIRESTASSMASAVFNLRGFMKQDIKYIAPNITADEKDVCFFFSICIIHDQTAT